MLKDDRGAIVHLIDDDELMLGLLSDMLKSVGISVKCYTSAESFLGTYVQLPEECIVSDVRMPGMSGIQLQKALLARGNLPSPLLLVTGFAEVNAAVEAMKLGAMDFIQKPVAGIEFIEKIQHALRVSASLHQQRLEQSARDARLSLLTEKERDVLAHLVKGYTSKKIADEMGLSVRTVENHRARMMSKLRVSTATELVREFLITQPNQGSV